MDGTRSCRRWPLSPPDLDVFVSKLRTFIGLEKWLARYSGVLSIHRAEVMCR
jgi:hypothetical protein